MNLLILLSVIILNIPEDKGVKFSWDANPESDLAGYILYNGLESGQYSASLDVGNVTEFTYDPGEFANFFTYYASITAYDASGNQGGFSSEVSFIVEPMQEVRWVQPSFNIIKVMADSTVWAPSDTVVFQGDTTGVVNIDFLVSHSEFSIFDADSFRIKYKPVKASSVDYERFIYDRDVTIITIIGDVTYEILCRAIENGIESIYSPARYFRIDLPTVDVDFETFKMILRIPFESERKQN